MPRFIEKSGKFFVSTNYKVMYSSLSKHQHILRISEEKFAWLILFRRCPHLLITRNPQARLMSAFIDKCRWQPMNLGTDHFVGWQSFHRLYFSRLGLSNTDPDEKIRDRFLAFTFKDFLKFLPQTMLSEEHLRPQHYLEAVQYKYKGLIPFGSARVTDRMKIEQLDHDELITRWGIDTKVKRNVTSGRVPSENLDDDDQAMIRRLYAKDFSFYGY